MSDTETSFETMLYRVCEKIFERIKDQPNNIFSISTAEEEIEEYTKNMVVITIGVERGDSWMLVRFIHPFNKNIVRFTFFE